MTLPGVVQRFATGHRIRVVVAAERRRLRGQPAPQPVTITTSAAQPSTLRLPLTTPLRLA